MEEYWVYSDKAEYGTYTRSYEMAWEIMNALKERGFGDAKIEIQ